MSRAVQSHRVIRLLRGAVAAGCAALVLGLAVLAASPELHAKLHSPDNTLPDECAVVLFATGIAASPPLVVLVPVLRESDATPPATPEELALASPRYLRQPERGPPEVV